MNPAGGAPLSMGGDEQRMETTQGGDQGRDRRDINRMTLAQEIFDTERIGTSSAAHYYSRALLIAVIVTLITPYIIMFKMYMKQTCTA